MPYMQAMAEQVNERLSRKNIGGFDREIVAPGKSLADAASGVGIAGATEMAYLDRWPRGLQEIVRAAIRSAVDREPRLPVTVAWMPGYDYKVTITEAPGTPDSIGGMTIILESRYPANAQP